MKKQKNLKVFFLVTLMSLLMVMPVMAASKYFVLPLGEQKEGIATNGGGVWQITVPADGKLDIYVNHALSDTSKTGIKVGIGNDANMRYYYDGFWDYDIPENENLHGELGVSAGTYYILVGNHYGKEEYYSIRVDFTPSDIWEYEDKNDKSTGNKYMELNKAYNGISVGQDNVWIHDYDWYKFNVDYAGRYNITLNHITFDSSATYWNVDLYEGKDTEKAKYSYSVAGNSTNVVNGLYLTPGTYFLRLASKKSGIVPYTLEVSDSTLSVLNGVDYSAVYNFRYYCQQNPDVAAACSNNELSVLTHFVNSGMKEGRVASSDFNVNFYRSNNGDLNAAFGNDLKAYYLHYMSVGRNEGRNATSAGPKGYTYEGVDYSLVYDYEFYRQHNPDVAAAFGGDADKLLAHFVNNGMAEGRQASAGFNLQVYKNNNPDLVNVFGTDNKQYYVHYITNGSKENRKAN